MSAERFTWLRREAWRIPLGHLIAVTRCAFIAVLLAGCSPDKPVTPVVGHSTRPTTRLAMSTIASKPTAPATPAATKQAPVWPTPRRLQGDLRNQVAALEQDMPRAGSEQLLSASDSERLAFSRLVKRLRAGNSQEANVAAADLGYELLLYMDHGDGNAESLVLRERKPIRKGWGLYIFRVGATSDVIIEAPHPLADEGTPAVALDAYRALNASALLVAGAHRNANPDDTADVAHNQDTVFQSIHETLTSTGTPIVLQIHGFASQKHPGYPPLVLGGEGQGSARLLDSLSQALDNAGIETGVCQGEAWALLCGTSNVQALSMKRGIFLHLELDERLRAQDNRLMSALKEVLGDR